MIWIILLAGVFQFFKIAADFQEEFVIFMYNTVIGLRGVVQYVGLVSIDIGDLPAQQLRVLGVGLSVDVKSDQRRVVNGNHVVKPKQAQLSVVYFHDMASGLDIGMIWLWGFHRDEVSVVAYIEDNTDIGPAPVLVVLYPGVPALQKADIFI